MTYLDVSAIENWHAHVYFDAASRDAAWQFREDLTSHFGDIVKIGRFHEKPVGPHPEWSFQLAFEHGHLAQVIGWLALNHGMLDVFLHPNTGNALRDHRDAALWIGQSHRLVLESLM
jgi:aromatic ring-cleaving dioxygenase